MAPLQDAIERPGPLDQSLAIRGGDNLIGQCVNDRAFDTQNISTALDIRHFRSEILPLFIAG